VIDANPAVKMQSASASPGIAIAPRAVVEVPMPEPDDGSTGSGAAVDIADTLSKILGRKKKVKDEKFF
jgi:hypothetical protein